MSDDELSVVAVWVCQDCGRRITSETIHQCPALAKRLGAVAAFKAVQPRPE